MILKQFILSCLILLAAYPTVMAQGQVSQSLNQILTYEQDINNPPSSIYIKLNTSNVDVQYIKGSRVMVTGKVQLGIPNLFFLEVLIKKGRYTLFLSPDGGSGLRLEDKSRQPMILQGEECRENVRYTIYIPQTITSVVFENALTGDSNIIAMNTDKKKTPPATQVSIKKNN